MACDHDATRASFAAFFGTTKLIGGQDLPGEGWVLMGNCVACDSTLTIPIAEPRGHAMHGEIGAVPAAPHESPVFEGETADQHAARIIT